MSDSTLQTTKGKRGRKSKLELMQSVQTLFEKLPKKSKREDSKEKNVFQDDEEPSSSTSSDNTILPIHEEKIPKKRGRRPKGGKIVAVPVSTVVQKEDKPNVILHLKCSLKDLNNISANPQENILAANDCFESLDATNLTLNNYDELEDDDEESLAPHKEIFRKLKQLEQSLHVNNVNNKKSACFWDTCDFDNPPVYIPKHVIKNIYHVYGCFCSPECAVAHLMNEKIDSSTKFERYHLLNNLYAKIYDYKQNIKPAPNPYYMLDKFCGNLSTQDYRSLLRNERLFLIVDKPLTRVMPELIEDNDDFILNNKIIPTNNNNSFQVKQKLGRRNKNNILHEKFCKDT
jgi:hypothetical protein